jgi:TonB family protein
VPNKRVLTALLISILIYVLLIFLYFYQLSKIKVPAKKTDDHVVKLNLINLHPSPVKAPTPVIKKKPPSKPVIKKETKEEKSVKTSIPKKVVKKKVVKKKPIIKKQEAKKKIVKKKTPKKEVDKPKVVTKKRESLKKFEEEMVYIPDATIKSSKSPQKQSDDLESFLSTPSTPLSMQSYPTPKVRKLYGSEYHQFTATQQKFIEENLDTIQQITQRTLTRRGYPQGAGETGQEGTNVVSFNLHPNGNISNLRLKTRTGYSALDENTITLIKVAYKDYPYPSSTTKIVFYVHYSIYGY